MSLPLERPNWDVYFLNIAKAISSRSPDPKKQVGCLLVENNRIVSHGYNGLPSKINENCIDWSDRTQVHNVIIHAEQNCLLYANKITSSAVIYCTLSPCIECLKIIRTCGIQKVVFSEKYKRYDELQEIADLFDIKLVQINETPNESPVKEPCSLHEFPMNIPCSLHECTMKFM